jgi:RND family efflux transporter MFP subunit
MKRLWLLLLLAPLASCTREAPASEKTVTPVRVATVEMYQPSVSERYSASITPGRQINLAFRVSGFVTELHRVRGAGGQTRSLEPGDLVAEGTVLARLRQEDYEIQVSQAQGALDSARQNEQTARSQIDQAQASHTKAEADFARAKALLEKQSITRADFDSAQAQFDSTRAQLESARTQLASSTAQIQTAEATLASANLSRRDTSLTAPFDAVVVQRNVEVGVLVSPGAQAYSLADINSVKATFGVPDMVAVRLAVGTAVSIEAEALPGRNTRGNITSVAAVADRDTRLFQVEVTLANRNGMLRPGMIASLSLGQQATLPAVPVVPLSAIVRDRENAEDFAVMVVEGSVARRRRVELGPTYGELLAVTNGVKSGERVVRTGATMITDGETVEVIP